MMVDPAGNLYYDTGSPQLGIYMVSNHTDAAADSFDFQAKLGELTW